MSAIQEAIVRRSNRTAGWTDMRLKDFGLGACEETRTVAEDDILMEEWGDEMLAQRNEQRRQESAR